MSAWIPGAVILGEYTIEKELGRGGMGRVWLVKSNSTGRRFAVKQALIRDKKHRRAFLTELQTWIDLPEHPNIVPCRFFRTVGDEIVIFADYIEGGSLADWISKGKLTGLEQILDAAIQFAWGLHAIHERGLIHQDVKPGNVLMTLDGVPLVTDFGLARARLRAADGGFVSPDLPPGQQSVLVSSGGMTPAYASPEQRAGKPLSRKTDIWSWGVSILDMFMGGVSCPHGGHIAADVLEALADDSQDASGVLTMPAELVDILKRCFMADQPSRWTSLNEVAHRAIGSFHSLTGHKYGRCIPSVQMLLRDAFKPGRQVGNAKWRNPREWLCEAYALLGRTPPAEITSRLPAGNRRSAAVSDLTVLEAAQRTFKEAIAAGYDDARLLLAGLLADKALVALDADDSAGALVAYDSAIAILESSRLIAGLEDVLSAFLADTYMHKGLVLSETTGCHREAAELLDKSIATYQQLVAKQHRTEFVLALARTLNNKARLLSHATDTDGALRLYEQARSLLRSEEPDVVEEDMARLCNNIGVTLCSAHREREALPYLDEALDLYSNMTQRSVRPDCMSLLANVCINKAGALNVLGDAGAASAVSDRAISICRCLREQHNDKEAGPGLARALMNRAHAAKILGTAENAVSFYDEAIGVLTGLVETGGRLKLRQELAKAFSIKAATLHNLGERHGALALFEKSIQIGEHLFITERHRETAAGLAKDCMNKARIMKELGRRKEALDLYDRAITVWRNALGMKGTSAELAAEADAEAAADLASAYLVRAVALKDAGDLPSAAASQKEGLRTYEQLGRAGVHHAVDLAKAYMSHGILLQTMGDISAADEAYKSAIASWEALVRRDGARQWAGYIADACLHRARVLQALGDEQEARRHLLMAQEYAVYLRK